MQVVGPSGDLLGEHADAFDLGCSHSGFTRIVWDESTGHFVMVCKTDNDNRIALPAPYRTIYPVDLESSNVGDLVVAGGGGYWLTASNLGYVHLLHFSDGEADQDIVLGEGDFPIWRPSEANACWWRGRPGTRWWRKFGTPSTAAR